MLRLQCQIYDGALKPQSDKKVDDTDDIWLEKWLFLIISPLLHKSKKYASRFSKDIIEMKINRLKKQKHENPIHLWSEKAFKGTVVNYCMEGCLQSVAKLLNNIFIKVILIVLNILQHVVKYLYSSRHTNILKHVVKYLDSSRQTKTCQVFW